MTHFSDRGLAYVRVPAQQQEVVARFAEDMLGLERVSIDSFALRSDERRQTLAFEPAGANPTIGLELRDEAALSRLIDRLNAAGHICEPLDGEACARRGVRTGFVACAPSGILVELVGRVELSGQRFYPRRDSGVTGLSAVGLRCRDIARDCVFWTDLIGAEVSDRVGDITYLRLDRAHHRIALYPSDRYGLLYVGFGVRTHDDLMRNAYFLQESQVRIVHGPGCETASGRAFVRFLAPDGQMFALDFGEGEQGADRRPRQFAFDTRSLCLWGSVCHEIPELAAA